MPFFTNIKTTLFYTYSQINASLFSKKSTLKHIKIIIILCSTVFMIWTGHCRSHRAIIKTKKEGSERKIIGTCSIEDNEELLLGGRLQIVRGVQYFCLKESCEEADNEDEDNVGLGEEADNEDEDNVGLGEEEDNECEVNECVKLTSV